MSALEEFRRVFAEALGLPSEHISLFWKGRTGLYGLLKVLEIGPGDEVILPAFTCVVVSNAILYTGARPVYADVDPDTYNLNIDQVEAAWSEHTRLVIGQNTFGLSCDLEPLADLCRNRGAVLLEDCTHGFGGTYKGQPNGTVASASFFSSQWNKPFSTGLGGMVACKDPKLASALRSFEELALPPSRIRVLSLRLQLFVRQHILKEWLYWPAIKLYRFLSRRGLLTGSSEGKELDGAEMPEHYIRRFSNVQARAGLKALKQWQENLQHRRKLAAIYDREMEALGVGALPVPDYAEHTYIKYPVLVRNRDQFLEKAADARIPLGDWMLSPIHPIRADFERWQYQWGSNPTGEYLSSHVVNLQTDMHTSIDTAERTCRFLREHAEDLIIRE